MNELKERSEKGTVLQYDKGIYSQPQQLRLTKQCLLTSLFYRALSMRSVCTHYLTSMRSYDGDESSYIYFLNVLSLFLKVGSKSQNSFFPIAIPWSSPPGPKGTSHCFEGVMVSFIAWTGPTLWAPRGIRPPEG